MPSLVRPERPERWLADAWLIASMGRRWIFDRAEYRLMRRRARVDDVTDARHGEARLGDVGREHNPATDARGAALEDAVLVRRAEAPVQRQHLGRGPHATRTRRDATPQRVLGIPDLVLARQEDQYVAVALARQLVERVGNPLEQVACLTGTFVSPELWRFSHTSHRFCLRVG